MPLALLWGAKMIVSKFGYTQHSPNIFTSAFVCTNFPVVASNAPPRCPSLRKRDSFLLLAVVWHCRSTLPIVMSTPWETSPCTVFHNTKIGFAHARSLFLFSHYSYSRTTSRDTHRHQQEPGSSQLLQDGQQRMLHRTT